jgi:hypothetical protein
LAKIFGQEAEEYRERFLEISALNAYYLDLRPRFDALLCALRALAADRPRSKRAALPLDPAQPPDRPTSRPRVRSIDSEVPAPVHPRAMPFASPGVERVGQAGHFKSARLAARRAGSPSDLFCFLDLTQP